MNWWEELDDIVKRLNPERERNEKHLKQVRDNWHKNKDKYIRNRKISEDELLED